VYRIFKFKITNPVEIYKSEIFAAKIIEKIKYSEIYSVVCFEYNSVVVANKLGITPCIAMVHNCIDELIKPLTQKELEQANKMTAYQVLMPSFVKEAQQYLSTEIVYIPNAIDKVTLVRQEKQISDRDKHTIICIGRLEAEQKQQHILLQAFALLADKYPQWEVDIYGLGYNLERDAYKEELLHIINKYKMEKQVHLKGVTDKILEKMCQADILAMPSAYEGFSMVLGDAMSIGLPAVGFVNAPSVNELIVNNVTGILCADTVKDYAAGLEKLMCNDKLRRELGDNAYLAAQEYSAEKVWNKWENLFKRLHEQ
ncbi:MAG: glycosyltransferase family 4 protein, partial [Acholeplasmataceae bacterium]|nr:glycosyltransferase family 4 protein [Acholeplasmataceae bacterium]